MGEAPTVATPRFSSTSVGECTYCGETIVVRPFGSGRWVHETGRDTKCDRQSEEWTL